MIKTIMPFVAGALSSDTLLSLKRLLHGRPTRIDVYLAARDPYSYLLVQVLPELIQRYALTCRLYTVETLQPEMYPEPEKWQRHAEADAHQLAKLYDLDWPQNARTKHDESAHATSLSMLAVERDEDGLKQITAILAAYWHNKATSEVPPKPLEEQLNSNQQRQKKAGHYLSAMIHCAGEWYWGLDRLDHLERRLNQPGTEEQVVFARQSELCRPHKIQGNRPLPPLEMFFSARSPYSYLGLERAVKLAAHYDVELVVKPVMPMVMRGLPVPQTKKMYIFHDTKREARKLAIPYGKVADPLGQAVKYCYALFMYAQGHGKGIDFLLAFGRAVNSRGIRADQVAGLRTITESAGLDWNQAKTHLNDTQWQTLVQTNMAELAELGHWGVPCFRYSGTTVWGQDRLWVMENAIIEAADA